MGLTVSILKLLYTRKEWTIYVKYITKVYQNIKIMEREIKFRAKRSYDKNWIYGSLLNIGGVFHLLQKDDMREDGHHISQESDNPTWVDKETIGQFTGLQDKNGEDIYEGDIIRVKEFDNDAISLFGCSETETIESFNIEECKGKLRKEFVSEVKYEDSAFLFSEDSDCDTFMTVLHLDMKYSCPIFECEVLGNVFDNPELIDE